MHDIRHKFTTGTKGHLYTYFRLLIGYQGEMNEGAEEPRGKARVALVICHIQIDMTTLNEAFFLVMM